MANSLYNWKLILLISLHLFPPFPYPQPLWWPPAENRDLLVLAHLHTTGSWCGTWLVADDTQLFVRFPLQCEAGRTSSTPISRWRNWGAQNLGCWWRWWPALRVWSRLDISSPLGLCTPGGAEQTSDGVCRDWTARVSNIESSGVRPTHCPCGAALGCCSQRWSLITRGG